MKSGINARGAESVFSKFDSARSPGEIHRSHAEVNRSSLPRESGNAYFAKAVLGLVATILPG
ncbi:MAG: hypothetical protein ACRD41_06325, partial [Candidatus Acidiferrales bacterium]